jgi:dephospho-CoA kinase
MTIVIGLTGNIGTGKSLVLHMLAGLGAWTIDADALAHEVMAPGGPAYDGVVAAFGPQIVGPHGEIDRSRLGEIVFADGAALAGLETLVHPAVIERTQRIIAEAQADVVVVEAIKLLEAGLAAELCDRVWVVTCSGEQQQARIMAQRGLTAEQARLRMEAQPPQVEKIAQADVVIDNSGTMEETRRQVEAAWRDLLCPPDSPAEPGLCNPQAVVIRLATVQDAAGIVDVLNTVVRECRFTALERPLTLDEEIAFLSARGPRDAVTVAECAGRIVGFQTLDPFMPSIASMAHVAQMGTYILPAYRRFGLGRRLFRASCDVALMHGYEKVVVYVREGNRGAQRFYRRLGFVPCGRLTDQTRIGDVYEDEMLFEIMLTQPEGR